MGCIGEFCVTNGDITSLIAVVIALWALRSAQRLGAGQSALAVEQNKLLNEGNRNTSRIEQLMRRIVGTPQQLRGSGASATSGQGRLSAESGSSDLEVRFLQAGRVERLIVRNNGSRPAFEIELAIEGSEALVGGSPQTFAALDVDEEWRVPLALSLADPLTLGYSLSWSAEPGGPRSAKSGHIQTS